MVSVMISVPNRSLEELALHVAYLLIFGPDLRLSSELVHHLRTPDSVGETGEVLDIGGGGELSSGRESDCSRVAGEAESRGREDIQYVTVRSWV